MFKRITTVLLIAVIIVNLTLAAYLAILFPDLYVLCGLALSIFMLCVAIMKCMKTDGVIYVEPRPEYTYVHAHINQMDSILSDGCAILDTCTLKVYDGKESTDEK